jgi:hypothetical protein
MIIACCPFALFDAAFRATDFARSKMARTIHQEQGVAGQIPVLRQGPLALHVAMYRPKRPAQLGRLHRVEDSAQLRITGRSIHPIERL